MKAKTKITEMFGIEHPIIQGGMHFVGLPRWRLRCPMPAGLGIITGLTQRDAGGAGQGDPGAAAR